MVEGSASIPAVAADRASSYLRGASSRQKEEEEEEEEEVSVDAGVGGGAVARATVAALLLH